MMVALEWHILPHWAPAGWEQEGSAFETQLLAPPYTHSSSSGRSCLSREMEPGDPMVGPFEPDPFLLPVPPSMAYGLDVEPYFRTALLQEVASAYSLLAE